MVKNLPSSARDVGVIPGEGTKIPHAVGNEARLIQSSCTTRKTERSHKIHTEMEGKHAALALF